jgi:hypothetical protein
MPASAGNDLVRDAGRFERQGFLAPATEHERVAALEPDHTLATLRRADHQAMDAFLIDRVPASPLADVEPLGLRRQLEQIGLHERIVEHEIRVAQTMECTQREQLRISRACADERDQAGHADQPFA